MTLTLKSDTLKPLAGLFRRLRFKSTLPILDHILVTVATGEAEARLETTDLDVAIAARLPFGGPSTPCAFTIPRVEFFHLAGKSDKGTSIRFDCELGTAKVFTVTAIFTSNGLRTQRTFEGFSAEDFPPPPDVAGKPVIFPSEALHAIRSVRPASSTDATRYVLNGVFISPFEGGNVVATDGRRLAFAPARILARESIIPAKVVDLLADPTLQTAATWTADAENEIAILAFGNIRLTFRLIQGNYPNYRQVIPTGFNGSCTFPAAIVPGFIAWLRQHKDNTVGLAFGGGVAHVTAYAKSQKSSTAVPALLTEGIPAEVRYNAEFLADGLTMGLHTLDLIDEMSPAVLTDGRVRYVLMPMKIMAPTAETPDEAPSDEPANPEPEEEPAPTA